MDVPVLPKEFDAAVARKDWETAAMYLIVTVAEFIEKVGTEAAEQMITELEAEDEPGPSHRGSRARKR